MIVFSDRKPRAKIHGLCIPKRHIRDINALRKEDIELLDHMSEVGLKVLEEKNCELEKTEEKTQYRVGFHVPPFNSIFHLHMHLVVLPLNEGIKDYKYGSAMAYVDTLKLKLLK